MCDEGFDVDVLAGLQRPDGRQRVPMVGRCDDDGVDVLVVEHAAKILDEGGLERRHVGETRIVDPLRGKIAVDIAQRLVLDVLQAREATLERVALPANAEAGDHDTIVRADHTLRDPSCSRRRVGGRTEQVAPERRRSSGDSEPGRELPTGHAVVCVLRHGILLNAGGHGPPD